MLQQQARVREAWRAPVRSDCPDRCSSAKAPAGPLARRIALFDVALGAGLIPRRSISQLAKLKMRIGLSEQVPGNNLLVYALRRHAPVESWDRGRSPKRQLRPVLRLMRSA